jgi:hypothetical protein
MTRLMRNLLSVGAGAIFGGFGGLLVLFFWPLLLPTSLRGSSWGEQMGPIAFLAISFSFAVAGFFLCRRLTRKRVREDADVTGRILFL